MSLKLFNTHNLNITVRDVYFTSEYGKACEYTDNATWECCSYKDLIYVYLKKAYKFENNTYYDLITPYGYCGYYYENEDTFTEFVPLFRKEAKTRNYLTEVVRQSPYIGMNIKEYDVVTKKKTFGINLKTYETFNDYLQKSHKDNKRGFHIATKNNLSIKMEDYNEENIAQFKTIYIQNMDNVKSSSYYYFCDEYYNCFYHLKEKPFFANVYKNNLLIASCIIFKFGKYLHYHLGGSLLEYRNLRPNNFLHCKVIEYGIQNKYSLYHLGGGIKDNDNLYCFKNKLADTKFHYTIYKNVLNQEIYYKIVKSSPENDGYFPIHR